MGTIESEDSTVGPKDVFLDSLARCDRHDLLERFYERFLASSPEVRQRFRNTDLTRQRRMLRRSLELMASATSGDPAGLRELSERAETHSRARLNIRPELYELWLDALIETARQSDPEWSPAIEQAWRSILGLAVRHMTRRYLP